MILDDLLYDRKADSAPALGRGARGIRPVKPVENIRQFLLPDPLSVILDLNLDKIAHIQKADIDDPVLLIHIFQRVADDVIDHPL